MKKTLIVTTLLTLMASCGTSKTKLTDGAKVDILSRKPGKKCSVIAKVEGQNKSGSVDLARNHARNLAANEGANSIYIDDEISNGGKWRVLATAYQCK